MEKLQRSVYILLTISLIISLLYVAREFLIPVALAGVLAMLFIRFCNILERRGVSRGFSGFLSVLLLTIGIGILVFLLSWQLTGLTENIESMKERASSFFQDFKQWIDKSIGVSSTQQEKIIEQQGQGGSEQGGNMLSGFVSGLFGVVVNTVLVLVYLFLFLFYRSRIKNFILKLVPTENEAQASEIIGKSTMVSQQYLGGLAMMIVMLWVMYGVGFTLIGVEHALFFAILCGVLEIVPFVGNITGTSITVLAVIAQGGQSETIIGVLVIYMIVQFIQTYLIEPLVVGDQVNINPLFTIMILVAGELVWGIAGMVLAIPLLGIVKIICDHIPDLKPFGYLIGAEKKRKKGVLDKIKGFGNK